VLGSPLWSLSPRSPPAAAAANFGPHEHQQSPAGRLDLATVRQHRRRQASGARCLCPRRHGSGRRSAVEHSSLPATTAGSPRPPPRSPHRRGDEHGRRTQTTPITAGTTMTEAAAARIRLARAILVAGLSSATVLGIVVLAARPVVTATLDTPTADPTRPPPPSDDRAHLTSVTGDHRNRSTRTTSTAAALTPPSADCRDDPRPRPQPPGHHQPRTTTPTTARSRGHRRSGAR
jgi:hypothetical protein